MENFEDIEIIIKEIGGKETKIKVSTSLKISELKQKISETIKIPADQQKLIHSGKVISDESKNLKEVGISSNDTVGILKHIKVSSESSKTSTPSSTFTSSNPTQNAQTNFNPGFRQPNNQNSQTFVPPQQNQFPDFANLGNLFNNPQNGTGGFPFMNQETIGNLMQNEQFKQVVDSFQKNPALMNNLMRMYQQGMTPNDMASNVMNNNPEVFRNLFSSLNSGMSGTNPENQNQATNMNQPSSMQGGVVDQKMEYLRKKKDEYKEDIILIKNILGFGSDKEDEILEALLVNDGNREGAVNYLMQNSEAKKN